MGFVKRRPAEVVPRDERRSPRTFVDLVASLQDPNPTARRWCARDLAAFPEATEALVQRLKVEEVVSVREVILTSLIHLATPEAFQSLISCLRSGDAGIRNQAIDAMKQFPDQTLVMVRGLLTDSDPDVRIFALNVLDALHHPELETWLIEVLRRDPHVNVCSTALDLLAEIGTEASVDALEALGERYSHEPYIQFAVGTALKRIRGS